MEKFDVEENLIVHEPAASVKGSSMDSKEFKIFLFEFLGMALFSYGYYYIQNYVVS
jgi:hypothetical protein